MRIESSNLTLLHYHDEFQNSMSFSQTTQDEVQTLTRFQESETLSLIAQGTIQTEEGKTINLSMQNEISRYDSYKIETRQSLASMVDPLVINLEGGLVHVDESETFDFDLNSDGEKDDISLLGKGSGFLALDRNENGMIDDGSELFGTQSGDGFSDLAAFDEDGNGWIDENDSVFSKLQIWQKSAMQDHLISLDQAKVGALLLFSVESSFTFKEGSDTNAKLKESSVVLFEDGRTGWMSHLDFSITPPATTQTSNSTTAQSETGAKISLNPTFLSKLKSSTSEVNESIIDSLKSRLKLLEGRLAKASDPTDKNSIMIQILKISMQIAQLGG